MAITHKISPLVQVPQGGSRLNRDPITHPTQRPHLKPPCCDTYNASNSFTNMSFRSAWRHAAKPSPSSSPSLPHIAQKGDNTTPSVSGGQSEPILVVMNPRPSSTHDLKMDQPVKPPVEAATKPQPPPETVPQDDANASDDPATSANKAAEQTTETAEAQDGRWFAWWGAAKADSTTATKSLQREQVIDEQKRRPSSAPDPITSTQTVPTTSPTTATSAIQQTALREETCPPSEPVTITPSPKPSADTSSGSYLAWLWSSRSPPKIPTHPKPENPVSESTTANGETSIPSEAQQHQSTLRNRLPWQRQQSLRKHQNPGRQFQSSHLPPKHEKQHW